jgi:plastocyanin
MKRVVVKVGNSFDLEEAKDHLLGKLSYLIFVEKLRSFDILIFDVPEENVESALGELRTLPPVKKVSWDTEYACHPVVDTNAVSWEHQGGEEISGDATAGTRNITATSSGTVYVKVQNFGGANLYVYSTTQGGVYSLISNYTGFLQGQTITFDQSDISNATHPLRFSAYEDGIWGELTPAGQGEFTTGVTYNGTAGQAGAYTRVVFGASTPSVLYPWCLNHPGMGRYDTSPNRYGSFNLHDFWHLDRITKSDRQYLNNQFSYTVTGDGTDLYVIDSGVRGASRPTGSNAALHPELFDPDYATNLNGTSEQQNYRVYQLPHYAGAYGSNNEDDAGHGTYCAVLAAGRNAGVSKKARIYSLKAFSSALSASYSGILTAYQAVIDHNDPLDANFKGNFRPAVINSSFGPTTPSGSFPYIELNDPGTDAGPEVESLDEIEKTVAETYNIVICRSAGNGFTDNASNFAGPLQAKFVAGARTAGYQDTTFNNVDYDTKKISVGATEYNDAWADFSNYGLGVTTVAPGARIVCPKYDWTTNTTTTSTANYNTINGTSFSCPIVTGIVLSRIESQAYTLNTTNLSTLIKDWIRTDGSNFLGSGSGTSTYPFDSMVERSLPTNPFSVTNGSSNLVIKYNSSDAGRFAGKVGKRIQLKVPVNLTVGGINLYTQSRNAWYTITNEDQVAYTITINLTASATATLTNTGGTGSYLGVISGTHEETDGPHYSSTTLQTQTDIQETYTGVQTLSFTVVNNGASDYTFQSGSDRLNTFSNTNDPNLTAYVGDTLQFAVTAIGHPFYLKTAPTLGTGDLVTTGTVTNNGSQNGTVTWNTAGVAPGTYYYICQFHSGMVGSITIQSVTSGTSIGTGLPVDSGVDYAPYTNTGIRGAIYPYVDSVPTWGQSAGSVSGSPFTDGDNININLGLSSLTTWASEPIPVGTYSYAGDSLNASGLAFDTATGILSGTVTSSYEDLTYSFTLTESNTGASQSYTFTNAGTGVLVTITQQPSSTQVEAGGGVNAQFGPVAGTSSDGSIITYQWQISTDGGSNWSNISSLAGHVGEITDTLTVSDNYSFDDNQYRCVMDTATAVIPSTTNEVTLSVYRIVTIGTQPTNQTPVAPATATFSVTASTLDAATIGYQWEKSEDDVTYTTIVGATSSTYTTGATNYTDDYGDYYRCVCSADGAAISPTSNSARLLLTRTISITSQPVDVTGAVGGTVQFSVTADTSDSAPGDITYQWQFSIDGGANWSNVVGGSGATTSTYTTGTLDSSYDEQKYRCLLNAAQATQVVSGSATLQVETVNLSVTQQPVSATVNEDQTATFTCAGTVTMGQIGANAASSSFDGEAWTTPNGGGGNMMLSSADELRLQSQHEPSLTYQWQRSDDGGSNWINISGATNPSYTTANTIYANDNADQYRCELNATGAAAPIYTNAATLTVLRTFSITAQPANQTGNENGTVIFSVSVAQSSGTPTFQWERSDDGGANWTVVNGATSSTYTTPILVYAQDNNDRYRCVVSLVGSAADQTSSFALLSVLRVITISQQPQSIAVIEGNTGSFSITAGITSDVISYQWQISVDSGVTWSNINAANSSSYTTPATVYPTSPDIQYRVVLQNVAATTVTSSAATLTVNEFEFVSAPTSISVNIDPDTLRTYNRRPSFTSTAFVPEYTGSTHFSSFWRIRRVSDNATVYDTAGTFANGDTGSLTTFTVPAGVLSFDTNYIVQVKYRDDAGLESSYSPSVGFTTPFVDQPVIQTIVPAFNPTVSTDPAEIKSGYVHTSSDWQFSTTNQFLNLVHQSLGNTSNLTSYILPQDVTLDPNTTYYVRIRFNVNPQ